MVILVGRPKALPIATTAPESIAASSIDVVVDSELIGE